MKKGLLVILTLALLVFVGRQVAADATDANTSDKDSAQHTKVADRQMAQWLERKAKVRQEIDARASVAGPERRTKIATGPNANAVLSLDLIANGGPGNQTDDGVTSGTVSGQGTTIAIEVFATGVTTPLRGLVITFDFDASVLTFVKAYNSAFALSLPEPDKTGTNFAATSPVTLWSSGFLARAEFTTAVDVTGRAFSIGIATVSLLESTTSRDHLTTTNVITFNAAPSPDFNGDGVVNLSDYALFVGQWGTRAGRNNWDAKFDLNGDEVIDLLDYGIFVSNWNKTFPVPPSGGGGGGSSSPDLIVESPSVSNSTLMTGQSFTLSATVRNQGTGSSASTTLRYYRSSDATISPIDTEVGTDAVGSLNASGTSAESISLNAPSSAGTYYYGACVSSVSGESKTNNNCSRAVRVTVSSGSETVTIPDANLRAVIADSLGKASGASITPAEMATLTRLDAPNKGIRNLTGLEHATNLQGLDLDYEEVNYKRFNSNDISNLSPLSNLANLRYLYLSGNSISDISLLSGLTNLTTLGLSGNSISDISPLSTLTNLTTLYLRHNSISDISPLSTLTNLTSFLELSGNSISDISLLSGLTNLTTLGLSGNSISDISPLSTLTNLTRLTLSDNSISDLAPLVANTGLGSGDKVYVRNNPLSATSINTHIPALQGRGVTVQFDSQVPPSGGGGGGACTAGLVVNPGESCTYKGHTFSVSSSGRGSISSFSAATGFNLQGTINGVQWNFVASKNSDSNSWTIHTAE